MRAGRGGAAYGGRATRCRVPHGCVGRGVAPHILLMRLLSVLFLALLSGTALSQPSPAKATAASKAGLLPAADRTWSGDDYLKVAKVLEQKGQRLPRLTDEKGRLFLQRLTHTANLAPFQNKKVPLQTRMAGFFNLLTGALAVSKLYLEAAQRGEDLHTEFAQQAAFQLRFAAAGVRLLDEYVPTIPRDANHAARMADMQTTYTGLMNMFAATADMLPEKGFFSTTDLTLMLTTMAETLPVVKKAFPADFRKELRQKLEPHLSTFPTAEGVKALQQMLDALAA